MSFNLKPSDGSARLLSAERKIANSRSSADDLMQKVQAHIQVIRRHTADMCKDTRSLRTSRPVSSSSMHWKQVYRVGRDTVAETRRLLHEIDPGSSSSSTVSDDKKMQRLMYQKLAESLERSSVELEEAWKDYVAAEASWAAQQQQESVSSSSTTDLEAGQAAGQLTFKDPEAVAAAELEMHGAIADEYAREVSELAQNMQGLQRAMMDLAQHTQAQGEMLEHIEHNMDEAADKTAKAVEQVEITEENQRKAMRFTLCLMMLVVGVSATVLYNVYH
mmetsp:Transcript_74431/g.162832  ORF Transcript_74431/g.162832 Transcript_74431/m.162832 type:complete len:276 (-) Transcript_74431:507-1334(-)|eukprot:CAMPEP_0206558472 /NCGR_PEP_ID=MMETSP0325_2-20121206/19773_1 /ASSEMBLY_ACC=CAM_ASM_000347 /TAXON_ID=2866 /ORGANISM="Crypthecodinium cohnii, Strain Seligo" /LENGTH=275 /DNA_ID=CAMNT_0054059697 /DNA_START=106 /DNA_END=933 /DNA_ORIENTATION=+